MSKSVGSGPKPRLLRGVIDQDGRRWAIYGDNRHHVVFSVEELLASPVKVFAKLLKLGKTALTSKTKDEVMRELEAFEGYEQGFRVSRLGWTAGMFLHGNGSLIQSRYDTRRPIVDRDASFKFTNAGTLESWQKKVGAVIRGQPLPLFLFSYAFVSAILDYAPIDVQNTVVELVGEPRKGKSTLVVSSGSIWGGNPETELGFAETWDITKAKIDPLVSQHRGHLLILDEGNLMEASKSARAEFLKAALFKLANTASRQRFTDTMPVEHTRGAYLSSSNISLYELIGGRTASDRAASSRMLTLIANRRHGVLDSIPDGFVTAKLAIEALLQAAATDFGIPGAYFVQCLLNVFTSEVEMKAAIQRSYESYAEHPAILKFEDPRHQKILAITCAAHQIAATFNILPAEWGPIIWAIEALSSSFSVASHETDTFDRILNYAQQRQSLFLEDRWLSKPLSAIEFDRAAGIWFHQRQWLLIPNPVFREAFPDDHREVLRELRDRGGIYPEQGARPRLSRKAPAGICADHGRRAYFVKASALR